ncbi:uncharacterized protein [Scyliorhinus torazame]|uniref:uncharacterized protein n=1 Tax=Scyliorhinus torazame TaxID=75743 RepID=UPI003B5921ED
MAEISGGATRKEALEQRPKWGEKNKTAESGERAVWGPDQQEFLKRCVEVLKKEVLAPMLLAIEGLKETQKTQAVELRVVNEKVNTNEDEILGLAVKMEAHKAVHRRWTERIEILENRSRRNNLRILGLPEGVEGADAGAYVSTMLHSLMGAEASPTPLELEGAHRVLARRPKADEPPRAIVARFHCFADKESVLRWAKKVRSSRWENAMIRVYQDWSMEVAKRRAGFNRAKALLHKKRVRFGMVQPA